MRFCFTPTHDSYFKWRSLLGWSERHCSGRGGDGVGLANRLAAANSQRMRGLRWALPEQREIHGVIVTVIRGILSKEDTWGNNC